MMRTLAENMVVELKKKKDDEARIDFLEMILTNLAKKELAFWEQREIDEKAKEIKWYNENFLTKYAVIEAIRKWWIKHPDITELVRELELNTNCLFRENMQVKVIKMLENGEIIKKEYPSVEAMIK